MMEVVLDPTGDDMLDVGGIDADAGAEVAGKLVVRVANVMAAADEDADCAGFDPHDASMSAAATIELALPADELSLKPRRFDVTQR
jgi:hypothetical protein